MTQKNITKITETPVPANDNKKNGPRPLVEENAAAMEVPLKAFGDELMQLIVALHLITKAPLGICANSALAVISLISQFMANVVVAHLRFPLSLHIVTVALSGERKTACDRLLREGIERFEKQENSSYKSAMVSYRAALKNSSALTPVQPMCPELLIQEPTAEGMLKSLDEGFGFLGLFNDDAGDFLGGHAMSKENSLKMVTILSKLWDGQKISRPRASANLEDNTMYDKRLAAHVMFQPILVSELYGNDVIVGQGWTSRILPSWPKSTMGSRFWKVPPKEAYDTLAKFNDKVYALLKKGASYQAGTQNDLLMKDVPLSEGAMDLFIQYHDEIEGQILTTYKAMTGVAAKAAENATRIAGALCLFKDPAATEVDESYMQGGIDLSRYYLSETFRMFELAKKHPKALPAQMLLDWFQEHNITEIYAGKIAQYGPNGLRKKAVYEAAIDKLVEYGWLEKMPANSNVDGVNRKESWKVVSG